MQEQIPLEQVIMGGRTGLPFHTWPGRGFSNRLEPEAWPQLFPRFAIEPGATIFTIGSCFARNIEDWLGELGFDLPMWNLEFPPGGFGDNREGVLNRFTPTAMHQEIEWASRVFQSGGIPTDEQLAETLLELPDGSCIDLHLGGLSAVPREDAIALRRVLGRAVARAFSADVVVITLGQTETWWDTLASRYFQRIPNAEMAAAFPGRFVFRQLGFADCLQYMRATLALLRSLGKPGKRFLITVSPVPMWRTFRGEDVLVANTFSKSLLRTVAGCLVDEGADVDYFPSYESVMLSQRDQVWIDDQLHVADDFVGKVVHRLIGTYLRGSVALGLAAAQDELGAGRAAEALAILEGLDPARAIDDFERKHLHWLSVRVLMALRRHEAVAGHLEALADLGNHDVLACRDLGDAWEAIDRPERAFEAIEHLPLADYDPAGIRGRRVRLLQKLLRLPEALAEYRMLADLSPARVDLQLAVARLALKVDDLDLAEARFRAACELAPTDRASLEGLVRVLLRRQRLPAVFECIEAAARRGASGEDCEALRRLAQATARG